MEPLEVRLLVPGRRCVFYQMRAVRPCCAVHPSTEAFGRPARELVSSKSLPQEEPTVAWRFYAVFVHHHDPLIMPSHGAFFNRPASPSQLCECPPFTFFPALRRESAQFRVSVLPAPNLSRRSACLAPAWSLDQFTLPPRFDLFLGVLRMANRSEAAFSPKRHW